MNTHTSGPWTIAKHSPKLVKVESAKRVICDAFAGTTEDEANARLIAAAPELLAALIAFRESGPSGGKDFAQWHQSYGPAIELARAAIAKATGA